MTGRRGAVSTPGTRTTTTTTTAGRVQRPPLTAGP